MKQTPMDDFIIRFQGFHPSEFTRTYLNEKMSALHEEAPYGANLQAIFTRSGRLFKGVLTIHSSVGRFLAVAEGRRLKWVTHKLNDQIRRQLDRWKTVRFKDLNHKEVQSETDHVA